MYSYVLLNKSSVVNLLYINIFVKMDLGLSAFHMWFFLILYLILCHNRVVLHKKEWNKIKSFYPVIYKTLYDKNIKSLSYHTIHTGVFVLLLLPYPNYFCIHYGTHLFDFLLWYDKRNYLSRFRLYIISPLYLINYYFLFSLNSGFSVVIFLYYSYNW